MDACLWPCLPTDGYAAVLDRAAPLCTLVYMLLCHVLTTYVCDSVNVGTLRLFYIGKAVRPCLYAHVNRHIYTCSTCIYRHIYTCTDCIYIHKVAPINLYLSMIVLVSIPSHSCVVSTYGRVFLRLFASAPPPPHLIKIIIGACPYTITRSSNRHIHNNYC